MKNIDKKTRQQAIEELEYFNGFEGYHNWTNAELVHEWAYNFERKLIIVPSRKNPLNKKETKEIYKLAAKTGKAAKRQKTGSFVKGLLSGEELAYRRVGAHYSDKPRSLLTGRFEFKRTLANPTPKKSQLITAYDASDIADAQADFLMEQDKSLTRQQALEQAYGDYDIYQWAWDDVKETLSEAMKAMGDPGYWKAEGRNMGWQHRSGHKFFKADNGEELMRAIFPNTDLSFKATWGPFHRSIEFVVYHHDAPTGEFYSVKPATKKEIEDGNFY